MAVPTAVTPLSAGHDLEHERVVNIPGHFYADNTGVTDATSAFVSAATAAGPGGMIEVGKGTFKLDWANTGTLHLKGAGMPTPGGTGGTTLKAKAAASWVLQLKGSQANSTIQDLAIDGNGRASGGILVQGQGAGQTSQGSLIERVQVTSCSTGVKYDASLIQTDKNSLRSVRMDDCVTGIWCNATNTQFTELDQVLISATTGVRMSGGTLNWRGGGCQDASLGNATGILIDNSNVASITLTDIINEGGAFICDIDGSAAWPSDGVSLHHCILQGSSYTVKIGPTQASQMLYALMTRFNTGAVLAAANDTLFVDDMCTFANGAAYTPTGSNNRRHKTDQNGITIYGGAAGATIVQKTVNATGDILLAHSGGKLGFYGATTIAKQTGVAVSAAGIHAALTNLGLIS